MTRHLALVLVSLLLGACGSGLNRPARAVPYDGGFAGLRLGSRVDLGPPRFVPDEHHTGAFALAGETVRVGGVPMDSASFQLGDDGILATVTLSAWSEDAARMQELRALGREVCAALGAEVETHIPSPLGTPEPGETWDPVITENETCSGESGGVRVVVSSVRNAASDFANHALTFALWPLS